MSFDYDLEKKMEWMNLSEPEQDELKELANLLKREALTNAEKERVYSLSSKFGKIGVSTCCLPSKFISGGVL